MINMMTFSTDNLLDMTSLIDPRFKTQYIKSEKINSIKARAITEMIMEEERASQARHKVSTAEEEAAAGGDAATLGIFFTILAIFACL